MLVLEKWGENRFKPFVMFAQTVAVCAEACHEMILLARRKCFLSLDETDQIAPNPWLRLYRQPERVEAIGLHFLDEFADFDVAGEAIDAWPQLKMGLKQGLEEVIRDAWTGKIPPHKWLQIRRIADRMVHREYQREHLPALKRMLADADEPPADFRRWFGQPEFVFLCAVAIPCWLECKETPWALYRRARNEDFKALETLARFDPDVEKERTLVRQVFLMRKKQPETYRLLKEAALAGRTSKITLKQIKYQLGGLLLKWSHEFEDIRKGELIFRTLEQCVPTPHLFALEQWIKTNRKRGERYSAGCRLTATDIKKLFDAVAQDRGHGLIDPDITGQQNSIYRNFARNAQAWPSLWKADKFRAA